LAVLDQISRDCAEVQMACRFDEEGGDITTRATLQGQRLGRRLGALLVAKPVGNGVEQARVEILE